jgi:Ras GTPase-activating-like protein IQGAP2/3
MSIHLLLPLTLLCYALSMCFSVMFVCLFVPPPPSFTFFTGSGPNTEQVYSQTKMLLFQIIKTLPSSDNQKDDIKVTITEARDHANRTNNPKMMEMVKQFVANCAQLVEAGVMSEADNYATLREDAIQELINYEQQLEKTEGDIVRLKEVLRSIHEHNHFVQQQLEAYKEYLNNVRASCSGSKKEKSKKEKSAKKSKKVKGQGSAKFSHKSLENDKIIVKSEVPSERKSGIQFSFSVTQPGMYRVKVLYKGRFVSDMMIHLDELLEYQHNNVQTIEVEFLTLNVNLLIYLLNKHFMAASK